MAWNEPGNKGGGNPWGGPPNSKNELEALFKKLNGIFGNGSPGNNQPVGKLVLLIVAALSVLWGVLGVYQLDEQKRAVVLRLGAFHSIVGPGIHWNPPLIDTVIKENVTQQRSYTTQGAMLTEDENIVEVQVSVQYNIGDLKKFTLGIRDPQHALEEATDSAVRHAIGSSKMDDVLTTGRDKIAVDVQTRLQKYLDAYQTGIIVSTVNIEKTQPPTAVQAAFDDVIKAREDEQRVQNEAQTYANTVVPEARGQVKRVHEEALAYRDRVVARAQGEAARFEALLTEYSKAPEITRKRLYLETMQAIYADNSKVLLNTQANGSNVFYLPLDKLQASNNNAENSTLRTAPSVAEDSTITVRADNARGRTSNNSSNNSSGIESSRREARP
ncbi:MAG TPA: FtsH protease activity modulator HflK [Pseudomonadales bacterium]|nr:FtsH protease activity modulator HflK [Pseudomonadales bacterium]